MARALSTTTYNTKSAVKSVAWKFLGVVVRCGLFSVFTPNCSASVANSGEKISPE